MQNTALSKRTVSSALTVEIVKSTDGIYESVNIVAGSCGPLETETVEHLCGVVVVGFYLNPYQRLVSHDVEGAAKPVMGIVLEVGFSHLVM